MSPRLWLLRRRCQQCAEPAVMSYHGWCPSCVRSCCDVGEGLRVGLSMPSDVDRAVGQLNAHIRIDGYRPRRCWTCALLVDYCVECETELLAMTAAEVSVHRVVSGWVVVGCEGYITAGLRSAATLVRA
jgi:hypothetical protein